MHAPKILVTNKIRPCGVEKMQAAGFDLVWSESNLVADVKKVIKGCDGIIARMTPVKEELIELAPELKVIGMHGVGLDGIDVELATAKGIAVTRAADANSVSVAENVMGMILALTKKTIGADHVLRVENKFQSRDQFVGHDIAGKTLGIVGMGRIGRRLASMAANGFGMKVIGYDPYVSAETMATVGNGVEKRSQLLDVVREADYLSFHTLMTPDMKGFVNYELLKQMKPTAYFINEMRGPLVNDDDLYRALEEEVIAGAALDVFSQEPTPPDYKLLKAKNLIATPHIGASTYESMDRTILSLADDFIKFFGGENMTFLVNPDYEKNKRF